MRTSPMHPQLLPYSPERDVYRLLQLDPSADRDEVVAACRRLARTFHPDFNDSPHATEEMQVVNAVRDLLTDPWSRAVYDANRRRYLGAVAAPARSSTARRGRCASAPWARRVSQPVALVQSARATLPAGERLSEELRRRARALLEALRAVLAAFEASRCPSCRTAILDEYRFCAGCGRQLIRHQLSG
jgi:curved DNA-binding protein CbpA